MLCCHCLSGTPLIRFFFFFYDGSVVCPEVTCLWRVLVRVTWRVTPRTASVATIGNRAQGRARTTRFEYCAGLLCVLVFLLPSEPPSVPTCPTSRPHVSLRLRLQLLLCVNGLLRVGSRFFPRTRMQRKDGCMGLRSLHLKHFSVS